MTRRPGRPSDRQNRSNRAANLSAESRGVDPACGGETPQSRGPSGAWGAASDSSWWAIGLALAALAYIGLFFSIPHHRSWLLLPLVPELIVGNWFGGAGWSGVGGWDRAGIVLALTAMTGLACGWGECLRRILGMDRRFVRPAGETHDPWQAWALRSALGWPLVSTSTLLVGLAGWLRNPGLVVSVLVAESAALAALAFVARRGAQADNANAGDKFGATARGTSDSDEAECSDGDEARSSAERRLAERELAGAATDGSAWTNWDWGMAVVVVVASVLIVCGGMLPAWEFDVREYHLQAPKEWWQRGRIEFLPHNVYANMPLGAEMYSLLAMTLWPGADAWWWGGLAGKAVVASFAPWTAVLLIAIGRSWNAPRAGWLAAALYVTTPWTAHVAMSGLIDGVLAFFVLATTWLGMALAARWWRQKNAAPRVGSPCEDSAKAGDSPGADGAPNGWLWTSSLVNPWGLAEGWACGWVAGAAAACKYPGVAFALTPVVAAVSGAWLRRRANWRCVAGVGLAALLIAGPWYVKNMVVTGNPTYPLFMQVWGGESRSPERDAQWRRAHREVDLAGSSYSWGLFTRAVARVGWRSDWLHPTLWPLALAGVLALRRAHGGWLLGAAIGWIFVVWWCAAHRIDRFWLPALPLLALLAGWGAMARVDRAYRGVAAAIAGVGIGVGWLASVTTGPLENPLGDVRFFASLARLREQNQHPLQAEIERRVPSDSALLMVGGAQPFDWRCDVRYSTCFDESPLEGLVALGGARERWNAFRAARISHVWVDWGEIARYRQPGNYGFPEFVTRALFDELQRQGVLRRLPADPQWGAFYEVPQEEPDGGAESPDHAD